MKILFLDIDGVLNNHWFNEDSKSCTLDWDNVWNLNKIILETECKIVLSSAWRYMIFGGDITLKGMEYLLRTHGVTEKINIIGTTCQDELIEKREDQIKAYLDMVPGCKHCVVDDLPLAIENFVKTDGDVGLDFEAAEKIIKILNG